jgi:hypothetical protein
MKIVSFMAAATVAVMMTLVGCGDGPGKTPETTVPPAMQVYTGTFIVATTTFTTGTITATITGISHDGTELADPALTAAIAGIGGAEQIFEYTLIPAPDMTSITLTGALLTALMLPEVTATKSGALGMDLATALLGTWMTEVTDPETMATTTLTLLITAPDRFTLTLTTAPPSS